MRTKIILEPADDMVSENEEEKFDEGGMYLTDRCIIYLTFLDVLHDGYGNDHFIPSRLERSTPPAHI